VGFISAEGRAIGWWVPEGLCRSKWSSFGCIRVKVCLGEVMQQREGPRGGGVLSIENLWERF
jgi:hypothetical protein